MAKKIFKTVGVINQKKENDEQGRATYCLKLDKERKITVDGLQVQGLYLNVARPTDKLDKMLAKGKITEAEYEEKAARYDKDGDLNYVKFEITAVFDEK